MYLLSKRGIKIGICHFGVCDNATHVSLTSGLASWLYFMNGMCRNMSLFYVQICFLVLCANFFVSFCKKKSVKDAYVEDEGPVCSVCERRVCRLETRQPDQCKNCADRDFVTKMFQEQTNDTPGEFVMALADVEIRLRHRQCPKTLVFLTARTYGENERLDVGVFAHLWLSLIQNQT